MIPDGHFAWSALPDFEFATPDFWEFPDRIKALQTIGGRCFAILFDGRTVDITNLCEGGTSQ